MVLKKAEHFVLGLDYGSDSCRAVLIDAATGEEAGVSVMAYPRWEKGLYCNPAAKQFRQHPQDYIDTLIGTVKGAINQAGPAIADKIRGIALDTTGSTPCVTDAAGFPLALTPRFSENPSAMFVLWKDHTSVEEAARINSLARSWGGVDYTKFIGGVYSAEWFWAKTLRVFAEDTEIAAVAASIIEHCDWMPALLTGVSSLSMVKRSRCAMGHKAMWHQEFGGYPSVEFFSKLDKRLIKIRESLGTETYTSDQSAGQLSQEWASRLGIPAGIPVAIGAYDAHMGAVGGGVKTGRLIRVMGTSTCDIIVGPRFEGPKQPVRGICGQVDGSVIPGLIGYEAGQSSFGDVYAWFKKIVFWPIETILADMPNITQEIKDTITQTLSHQIIPRLEDEASRIDPIASGIVAMDWLNGRRTPNADQHLTSAITGLTLGSDAPSIYRALAESTAFGARSIVDCFNEQGVSIKSIVGIGGVARKSPLIMQLLADIINMPVEIPSNDQAVALGAAIFAAVVAGLYPDVLTAQQALASPIEKTYLPNPRLVLIYQNIYRSYKHLGNFVEESCRNTNFGS
jgi:L-ribulokinase